jgi:hypothetical protein
MKYLQFKVATTMIIYNNVILKSKQIEMSLKEIITSIEVFNRTFEKIYTSFEEFKTSFDYKENMILIK